MRKATNALRSNRLADICAAVACVAAICFLIMAGGMA